MQGHHHPMSGGSVPVGSMGQQGMEIHSSGHGFLSPHQAGGVSAMQMQMMPNVSHSMGIPNPHLPMHRVAPVPVATSVRHHHQASGGGVGMSRGHGAHGSALYGAPDTSMMMPISIQGGSGGGMIDLCDLQPTISAAQVGHNKPPELQGLEMLVSGVQQDASFLSAVSARQPDAAAIAAVIRMKAMLAQNPTLLHAMTGRHQAAGGNVEALYQNQRVVVQAHKKTPARFVGQEGVVVTPPVNEWLVLRVAQTGEVIRIHQRCVSPISHSDMLSIPHHDLIDNDDLDALPDIDLLGDGDIVLDAGISSTNPHHHHHQHQHQHQHQHSNTAIATGHGSMQHQLPGPGMPASHEVVTAFHGGNDGGAGGGGGGGGGGGVVGGGDGGGGELGLPEMEVAPPAEAVMSLEEQRELFRTVQADLLALEAKVPWALAKLSWQQARPSWAETLRGCCTLDECAYALQLLYRSLHLSKEEAAKGSDGGGGGHGGLAALMKALTVRLASGRPVATFLRQHWAEARGELERWLERRSGGGQLAALEGGLLKAIVALEGAAGEGEEAALQVPLEAIVGRNAESLSVLKDVLERERAELVSKATQLWTGPDPTELPHERLTYEATEKASFVELLATRLQLHRSSANGHRPGAEDDNVSETTDLDDSDMEDTM